MSITENIRNDFSLLRDTDIAYLDNAATTQKPDVVISALTEHYQTRNANVHRGIYDLSEQATAAYEQVRDTVQHFINAQAREEIIFTSGTTASLNLTAHSLSKLLLKKGDVILLSASEHHSNMIPWQLVAQQLGATIEWLPHTEHGSIDNSALEEVIHDNVKIVAVASIANSTGSINPIEEIISIAHSKGVPVVVDAAQSVPHVITDVQKLDCDFLAFSAHKMCGPTGVGVLYGKREWLEKMEPFMGGGEMINEVQKESATWAELPYKFEAGTPNIAGVVGLGAAITYLQQLGMVEVHDRVEQLYTYLLNGLDGMSNIKLIGDPNRSHRNGIASLIEEGVHPHDIAQVLSDRNVAVRAGHHCAQPLMRELGVAATTRASLYFYNTESEIDRFLEGLQEAQEVLAK